LGFRDAKKIKKWRGLVGRRGRGPKDGIGGATEIHAAGGGGEVAEIGFALDQGEEVPRGLADFF
jgi:hypothetical protein